MKDILEAKCRKMGAKWKKLYKSCAHPKPNERLLRSYDIKEVSFTAMAVPKKLLRYELLQEGSVQKRYI